VCFLCGSGFFYVGESNPSTRIHKLVVFRPVLFRFCDRYLILCCIARYFFVEKDNAGGQTLRI
jgi:hypothetical protein